MESDGHGEGDDECAGDEQRIDDDLSKSRGGKDSPVEEQDCGFCEADHHHV